MIRPTQDYVVVKPQQRETGSIIALPVEEPCQGVVVAVGPGKPLRGKVMPLDVRVGETVRFKYHETYQRLREGDDEYLVIREPDIEFIIE